MSVAVRAQDEMAAARRESELARTAKTRFLANVSHELRTPLNAIIGFSDMLANPEMKPQEARQRREFAQIISDSGRHLHDVVNTIIDLSKIETGAMQILVEPFSLGALMESVLRGSAAEGAGARDRPRLRPSARERRDLGRQTRLPADSPEPALQRDQVH